MTQPPASPSAPPTLPAGVTVFERGWLSSNNILLVSGACGGDAPLAALVDSGYATHAGQTLALLESALGGRPLDLLLNTHLHSDHCGGNAALQARYPALQTRIPAGEAQPVADWDEDALSYLPTGQQCPRFGFDAVLRAGDSLCLAGHHWQVHAAPGHDPHSVIFFEPASRTLISADALWANGFGVVFPEIEGVAAFDEVDATLDLIEALAPALVIPGHGSPFTGVAGALAAARRRLEGFQAAPAKHAQHAAKVLLKFKLLEWQRIRRSDLLAWAGSTRYFSLLRTRHFADTPMDAWITRLTADLVRAGAAADAGDYLLNA